VEEGRVVLNSVTRSLLFLAILAGSSLCFGQNATQKVGVSANANPSQDIQEVLSKFTVDELKEELISRGNKARYGTAHPELENINSAAIIDKINSDQKGLYNPSGADRRRDFWEIQDPTQLTVTNSTVAFVLPEHYKEDQSGLHLSGQTLGEYKHLCSGEPYFDQPVVAYCTGFVVGPDLIATAGHCIKPPNEKLDTKSVRIVFGFRRTRTANKFRVVTEIPKRDVYTIASVVDLRSDENGPDYAILRVDRQIKDHLPLPLDLEGAIVRDDELYALGFPTGLPMKLADQANVRFVSPDGYFVSNLDTFSGNSGSPVLKSGTLTVEGILIRGGPDYSARRDYCQVAYVCPVQGGCRGEDSTLLSALSEGAKEALGVKPQRSPRTETYTSPAYPSGIGGAFSPEYVLTSGETPAGYKIAHYEYSLTGDRACNQWSACVPSIEGNRVVLRFKMQGHNEWLFPPRSGDPGLQPGQAYSTAHLVVTFEPI
jgi:trypsin-like peptidase